MRNSMLVRTVLFVMMLTNANSGCAQTQPSSLRQRIAARAASEEVLGVVFQGMRGARHEWSWPDLPLETRLALIVSSTSSDGWDDNMVTIINSRLEVVALLSKDPKDIDTAVMVSAKYASDDSEVRALEKTNEIGFNKLITSAWAGHAVNAERAIGTSVGPKLKAIHDRLTAAILERFNQRPDLLTLFAKEKPESEELKQSRATVKAMLDTARKNRGH